MHRYLEKPHPDIVGISVGLAPPSLVYADPVDDPVARMRQAGIVRVDRAFVAKAKLQVDVTSRALPLGRTGRRLVGLCLVGAALRLCLVR